MVKDPLQDIYRQAAREQRLGPDAVCVLCGESEYPALTPANRRLLEDHHLAGKIHDKRLTVPLCRNCHAMITEGQLSEGMDLQGKEGQTLLHKVRAVLLGLGIFFMMLGEHLLDFAEQLSKFIFGLDRDCPAWRDMPEARP